MSSWQHVCRIHMHFFTSVTLSCTKWSMSLSFKALIFSALYCIKSTKLIFLNYISGKWHLSPKHSIQQLSCLFGDRSYSFKHETSVQRSLLLWVFFQLNFWAVEICTGKPQKQNCTVSMLFQYDFVWHCLSVYSGYANVSRTNFFLIYWFTKCNPLKTKIPDCPTSHCLFPYLHTSTS